MIRLIIISFLIGFLFTNCVSKVKSDKYVINQILPNNKRIFVEDSTLYSPEFINELRALNSQYDSLKLIGQNIIINKNDTLSIPTLLPIEKQVVYIAKKDTTEYCLALKRINITCIDYEFKINDKIEMIGQVSMDAQSLFFGTETSSEEYEQAFALIPYYEKKDCLIILGVEFENANKITFDVNCENDSSKSVLHLPIFKK